MKKQIRAGVAVNRWSNLSFEWWNVKPFCLSSIKLHRIRCSNLHSIPWNKVTQFITVQWTLWPNGKLERSSLHQFSFRKFSAQSAILYTLSFQNPKTKVPFIANAFYVLVRNMFREYCDRNSFFFKLMWRPCSLLA